MSRRRGMLAAVVGLLLLVVGCVWLVPGLLDWNRYREGIASIASARLGRAVHIGGGVSLSLLPQPILTASDVSVDEAGDGVGLSAKALRLRVGLGALLGGTVDARELTLQGAELRLPWPPVGSLSVRPPPWVSGLSATVEDSRLVVGGLVFSGIDATLTTDVDTGTLAVAGVGQSGARRWQFTARLARPGRDGSAGIDISLDGQGPLRDTGGTFTGQIAGDGALAGRVAGRGPDLSQLMPAPAVPWRGDGRLNAAGGLAAADELALEIGGAPARGAVALRVTPEARLDLAIAAGRLDLDQWLPALLGRNPGTLRAGLPTGIDLSAEAATLAGGTLRRVRAAIDVGGDAVLLRDVAAVLPGEAALELSGRIAGAAPQFTGQLRLTAPELRTTLRWASRLVPAVPAEVPAGVLRTAVVSARLVGAGSVAATELQGTLDGTAISGSLAVKTGTVKEGARVGISAALSLQRASLDAFVPEGWRVPSPEVVLAALRSVDAEVRLRIADARWGAIGLGAATLEAQTEAGRVLLRRLEAQPLGMALSASGQVGDGFRLTDGRIELAAPDLSVLRPYVPEPVPAGTDALLRGPGSLVVQAAGPPEALAGRVVAEMGDLRLEAKPSVNLLARQAAGALTVHHPGAPRLLELLGLGGTASWLGDGSFSLVGQVAVGLLAVGPGKVALEGATLAAGGLRATGRLSMEGRRVSGQVAAETLPLPLLYPRSPDPLPFGWLRGWDAGVKLEAAQVLVGLTPVLQAASAGGVAGEWGARLSKVAGRSMGGSVAGTMTLDTAADPPRLVVQGQSTGLAVAGGVLEGPVDVQAGQAQVAVDLAASGFSPAALLSTLGGSVLARLRDGLVSGFDLGAAGVALGAGTAREVMEGARAALLAGSTPIGAAEVQLTVQQGVAEVDGRLSAEAGAGTIGGSLDLRGGDADLRLALSPAKGPAGVPALGLRLSGAVGGPTRTPELAGLARWLAERP